MRFLSKILLFTILTILAGCNRTPQSTQMRIVDLQGNPHNVQMRTPELNMKALAAQGNLTEEQIKAQPRKADEISPAPIASNKYASSNFAGSSSEALQNTLQLSTDPQRPNYNPTANEGEVVEVDILTANEGASNNKNSTIEYSLGENKKPVAASLEQQKDKDSSVSKKQKGLFVQTGSFAVLQHAKLSLQKVKKFSDKKSKARIEEALSNNQTVYRVLIGPFSNKKSAKITLKKLEKSGHKAIIIRNK